MGPRFLWQLDRLSLERDSSFVGVVDFNLQKRRRLPLVYPQSQQEVDFNQKKIITKKLDNGKAFEEMVFWELYQNIFWSRLE